jgi:hypothetical protein
LHHYNGEGQDDILEAFIEWVKDENQEKETFKMQYCISKKGEDFNLIVQRKMLKGHVESLLLTE